MVYERANSFGICTYKKQGAGDGVFPTFLAPTSSTFERSNVSTFRRVSARPIAEQTLWCNNSQRHGICSRSEQTTPHPSVSKTSERTSGTARQCSRLPPTRSRFQVHRLPVDLVRTPGSLVLTRISLSLLTTP